jgi:hypothetical protein
MTSVFFTMRLVKLTEGYHLYTLMSVKYHTVHRESQSKRRNYSHVEVLTGRPSNLVTPPRNAKQRQQDLSSGNREPTPRRRERAIARVPSPLAMQSAVLTPSIHPRDLASVASETRELTNFAVDCFTWLLQRDLDLDHEMHERRSGKIWCAPYMSDRTQIWA